MWFFENLGKLRDVKVNLPGLLCDRDLKKEVFEERKNENFEENKASVTQANEAMGEQPPLVPLISKIC